MKVVFAGIAPRRAKSERLPFIKSNFLVLNLAKLLALGFNPPLTSLICALNIIIIIKFRLRNRKRSAIMRALSELGVMCSYT